MFEQGASVPSTRLLMRKAATRSERRAVTHWVTLLLLFSMVPTTAAAQQTESPTEKQVLAEITEGRMYVRGYCSRCHGLDAKGGQAPDLTQRVLRHGNSDEAIARNIRDGIPGTGMMGFGWTDERIRQVIRFLRSQQSASQSDQIPGEAAKGRKIFEKHQCNVCHWTGRSGGRRGPDLSQSRGSLAYLRQALVDPAEHVASEYHQVLLVRKDGRLVQGMRLSENSYYIQLIDERDRLYTIPKSDIEELHRPSESMMPNYQKELSAKDLDNLIAYVLSLRKE